MTTVASGAAQGGDAPVATIGRVICLVGLPGAGKSTLALRLCAWTGGTRHSPGDWLRTRARHGDSESRDVIGAGRLLTTAVFEEWLADIPDLGPGDVQVFDGATRTEEQARALLHRYRSTPCRVDVVHLDVDPETARVRLGARRDTSRADDTATLVDIRLARNAEEMSRTLEVFAGQCRLHVVDATPDLRSVERVIQVTLALGHPTVT